MRLKLNLLVAASFVAVTSLYGQEATNKNSAENWIKANAAKAGVKSFTNLSLKKVRQADTGETLRYQQYINDVPVYGSELILHYNKSNQLTYVAEENIKSNVAKVDTKPAIAAEEAFQKAFVASKAKGDISFEDNKLYVYVMEDGSSKLVYKVNIISHDHSGNWETLVDAKTGDVLSVKDVAYYYNGHGDEDGRKKKSKKNTTPTEEPSNTPKKVTGTAYIFEPDPLSKMQVVYGGQYVDNNDATNASLDAARSLKTIPELELLSGVYKLKGQYAEIRQIEAPATGLFTQTSPDFLFNRFEQGFEAANVYWHLDHNLRYINETLGIDCTSLDNSGVVLFDPHGVNGDDNSYYSAGRLVFGEGCVDDGEDADVIIHELGHGVHDWLTNGNLSQVQGLSEGSGDYWGQSYSRSLNQWPSTAAQYQWFFSWDGHNECWGGRTTNFSGNYPPTGGIHNQGQLWATVLMRIFDIIGKEKTDRIFLEGLAMTGSTTNQYNAAIAVRQAAIDMLGTHGFTCDDVAVITQQFNAKNYNLPAVTCTAATNDVNRSRLSVYPNPVVDNLTVSLDFKKQETAEIYSIDGKKVLESKIDSGNNTLNVSNLVKGIYILKIKGTDSTFKFIKK